MAQTPPAPQPGTISAQNAVRISATKIEAAARQILLDLARGRLVRSSGRQIAAEVIILCEAIILAAEAEKAAAAGRAAA